VNTYYVVPEINRMKTFQDNVSAIEQNIDAKNQRIHELEPALNRMLCAHENTLSESEGRWPYPDQGCIYCTHGTVPDHFNTGPCAFHDAQRLLGQL